MKAKFYSGNIACAEGAITAGCKFFAGYPITPSTEIAEHIALRLPKVGGIFIQMEDEIASIAAVLGASWGGLKAMTATSGPGFSLMQENIGLAAITETPCVIVDVQRAGPSTGMPTLVGQGDVMQARWGSHGDYEIIAVSPSTPEECFYMTIRAFNLAEKYRCPVIVLMDESVAHTGEKIIIDEKKIEIFERKKPVSKQYIPFEEDALMASCGDGYAIHVTGLTHDKKGYPMTTSTEVQEWLVRKICDKIRNNEKEIRSIEEFLIDDAKLAIVSFGSPARSCKSAIKMARKEGYKVGMIRLKTIWPFPEEYFEKLSEEIDNFLVVEVNYGQIKLEVERTTKRKVNLLPKMGGEIHKPDEIYEKIKEVYND